MSPHKLKKGNLFRLIGIEAEEHVARHLSGLGFVTGVEIEIISDYDPYIVQLKGSRLALSSKLLECLRLA